MKRLIVALAFVCGCQDALVIVSDDDKLLIHCMSGEWVKCVHDACPNGYAVIRNSDDNAIIKCKPACCVTTNGGK